MNAPASSGILIRQAAATDAENVSAILLEAAAWLTEQGLPMWKANELAPEQIVAEVAAGQFYLAESEGEIAGTIKFQLEDPLFWPDLPAGEAAYIHRLAVRRALAGGGVSQRLMQWAADRAVSLGRRFLRLDCEAARPRLRAVYERFGFRHHSDRQVGPYFVARYERALTAGLAK